MRACVREREREEVVVVWYKRRNVIRWKERCAFKVGRTVRVMGVQLTCYRKNSTPCDTAHAAINLPGGGGGLNQNKARIIK